jgi:phasin family protein
MIQSGFLWSGHPLTLIIKETPMNATAEQFTATNKANLEALEGFTTQAFAGVEKLVELNMATSKSLLSESFSHVQAVLGAKDAQELQALQAGLLKPLADKSAAYAQNVQTIVSDSGAEFTKAIEAKTAEAQKAFSGVVENLVKNAPAGSESAVTAFKNALTAGQNAVETAQASVKQAVEAAQSNFTTATTQASDAVKKATKSSKTV